MNVRLFSVVLLVLALPVKADEAVSNCEGFAQQIIQRLNQEGLLPEARAAQLRAEAVSLELCADVEAVARDEQAQQAAQRFETELEQEVERRVEARVEERVDAVRETVREEVIAEQQAEAEAEANKPFSFREWLFSKDTNKDKDGVQRLRNFK